MTKYYYFLFFSICFFSNSFSQEIDIPTEFSQDGILYESLDESARNLTQFKTDEKCSVLEYLGKDKYKVRYNEFVGYVDSQYLVVNEDMMDLFYAYQDAERLKAIERDENGKKEIQEIIRKSEAEKSIRVDTIVKIKEENRSEKPNLEQIEFRSNCHYAMNEFDIFNKIKIIRTDPYEVCNNLSIELYKRGESEQVFFNLSEDLGCVSYLPSNRSYVKIQLENNKVITLYHSWDIDCGNFAFKGNLSNSQIVLLEKSPIKSIKFKGTKNSYEITNVYYKEFFMDKLKCLN